LKTYVIANDFQLPFDDKACTKLVVKFIQYLKPDGVVLNGDVVDSYQFSTFQKDPLGAPNLQDEIKAAKKLMGDIANVREKADLFWLGGNHEDRHRRFMWANAPALASVVDFPKLFDLADFGFRWMDYGEILELGYLMVTHGNVVRAHSAWTAKKNFETFGRSNLTGHTHRLGVYYRRNSTGLHAAYENGCLCRLDLEYIKSPFPDWHHGFSVVHFEDKNGWFHVQQLPILEEGNLATVYYGTKRVTVKR